MSRNLFRTALAGFVLTAFTMTAEAQLKSLDSKTLSGSKTGAERSKQGVFQPPPPPPPPVRVPRPSPPAAPPTSPGGGQAPTKPAPPDVAYRLYRYHWPEGCLLISKPLNEKVLETYWTLEEAKRAKAIAEKQPLPGKGSYSFEIKTVRRRQ